MDIGRSWLWMVGVAALAVGAACGGDDNGDGGGAGDIPADAGPATTPTTPPTTVSFSTQVHPILTTSCTPCHSGTFASSTAATSFAEAQTRVNTGAPAQSALLQKGNAQVAHGGGDKLSDADAQTILTWTQEGATNN